MNQKIAQKISRVLSRYSPQNKEESIVIEYGIEIILEFIIKIFIVISLGIVCNKLIETIFFLLTLSVLRSQAGGIHAKTGWGCLISMIVVWSIGIYVNEFVWLSKIQVLGLSVGYVFIFFYIAPQFTDKGIQLDRKRMLEKKFYSVLLVICFMTIAYFNCRLRGVLIVVVSAETITITLERRKRT